MKKLIVLSAIVGVMGSGLYANSMDSNASSMKGQHHKMMKKKMGKKRMRAMKSIFLIQRGLPHYSMILKHIWNDKELALTKEQKSKLLVVRKETIGGIKKLLPEYIKLKKEILKGARGGADVATLSKLVDKVASIKAEATKIHLKCISDTKAILTKEQMKYLEGYIRAKRDKHKKKREEMMKRMRHGNM